MVQKRRPKKFTPRLVPRYLKYQVHELVWGEDLFFYNMHLRKIFNMEAHIDNKPPILNPKLYFDKKKLQQDAARAKEIEEQNKQIIKSITKINKIGGDVNSINPLAFQNVSKWRAHELEMLKHEKFNKRTYKAIKSAKSYYDKNDMDKNWERTMVEIKEVSKFPLNIFIKQNLDQMLKLEPSICGNMGKIGKRFYVFLEFTAEKTKYLGRVIIELYHDHMPVTVQNFMEICKGTKPPLPYITYRGCPVHRIMKGAFLTTGDVTHGNGKGGTSIYGKSFEEEGHLLQHTKACVLSMQRINKNRNNSQFSITFKAMPTLDRRNVVFGEVVDGAAVIMKIEGYGRSIGKPLQEVVISDSGEVDFDENGNYIIKKCPCIKCKHCITKK